MSSGDEHPEAFPLLAFLWGCAHALSELSATTWFADLQQGRFSAALVADCVVFAVAIAVIVRPSAAAILASLAAAQVVQTVLCLPEVPNHRLLMFCVNVGLLLTIVANRLVRDPRPLGTALAGAFSQVALCTLAAVYFFATLAKLNTDFLDPEVSCGGQFLGHVTRVFPLLGFTQASAAIWLTIVVEGLLVPGLLFRKTRRAAVLVGLLFHFGVALDLVKRFYNFSAVTSALLTASLGAALLRDAARALESRFSPPVQVRMRPLLAMTRAFFAVWLSGLFVYGLLVDPSQAWRVFVGAWLIWTMLGAFCIGLAAAAFLVPVATHTSPTRVPRVAIAAPLLLVVANGCGPYLGYKTRTSFNMYSNLRLEANAGNHLLFDRSLDVFGYLADDVELLETNDAALRRDYLDKGYHITYFELERHLAGRDPDGLRLVIRRNGRVESIGDAPRPTIAKRLLWKLLVFRPLGSGVVKECIW
jgi:hypothetical protein